MKIRAAIFLGLVAAFAVSVNIAEAGSSGRRCNGGQCGSGQCSGNQCTRGQCSGPQCTGGQCVGGQCTKTQASTEYTYPVPEGGYYEPKSGEEVEGEVDFIRGMAAAKYGSLVQGYINRGSNPSDYVIADVREAKWRDVFRSNGSNWNAWENDANYRNKLLKEYYAWDREFRKNLMGWRIQKRTEVAKGHRGDVLPANRPVGGVIRTGQPVTGSAGGAPAKPVVNPPREEQFDDALIARLKREGIKFSPDNKRHMIVKSMADHRKIDTIFKEFRRDRHVKIGTTWCGPCRNFTAAMDSKDAIASEGFFEDISIENESYQPYDSELHTWGNQTLGEWVTVPVLKNGRQQKDRNGNIITKQEWKIGYPGVFLSKGEASNLVRQDLGDFLQGYAFVGKTKVTEVVQADRAEFADQQRIKKAEAERVRVAAVETAAKAEKERQEKEKQEREARAAAEREAERVANERAAKEKAEREKQASRDGPPAGESAAVRPRSEESHPKGLESGVRPGELPQEKTSESAVDAGKAKEPDKKDAGLEFWVVKSGEKDGYQQVEPIDVVALSGKKGSNEEGTDSSIHVELLDDGRIVYCEGTSCPPAQIFSSLSEEARSHIDRFLKLPNVPAEAKRKWEEAKAKRDFVIGGPGPRPNWRFPGSDSSSGSGG